MNTKPKRVFRWNRRHEWERVMCMFLANKLTPDLVAEVQKLNPVHLSDDNFAWLNSAVASVTKQPFEDIPALLAKLLSEHYHFLVAYHGTRSSSATDFLQTGVALSDTKLLEQRAVKQFGQSERLQNAISELHQSGYARHNHGKIFFCLTKQALLKESRHYLLEGSEYVAAIANRVDQNGAATFYGKPLIVECVVPVASLDSPSQFWRGRSFAILEDYFNRVLATSKRQPVKSSCCIATQPILAEHILRVHEFSEVKRSIKWKDFETQRTVHSEEIYLRPFKIWSGKACVNLA